MPSLSEVVRPIECALSRWVRVKAGGEIFRISRSNYVHGIIDGRPALEPIGCFPPGSTVRIVTTDFDYPAVIQ